MTVDADTAIAMWNPEGRLCYANAAYTRLFGPQGERGGKHTGEELGGIVRTWNPCFPPAGHSAKCEGGTAVGG
ncbi:MAG: hypothetical protein FD153_1306 [Rhodospirillaceae bacterium]|nr:MAG: hypothetical protein FD153_1306 [Rhodospirillaceae bacterium]